MGMGQWGTSQGYGPGINEAKSVANNIPNEIKWNEKPRVYLEFYVDLAYIICLLIDGLEGTVIYIMSTLEVNCKCKQINF